MKFRITAPDTMRAKGMRPIRAISQGGVWSALGSLLALVVTLIPTVPLPDNVRPWLPAIGALLGWLSNLLLGPDPYEPIPPPAPPIE
jgi:hypothetical protein